MQQWFKETLAKAAPNSALAKAITYSIKRWPSVLNYLHHGDYPLDNNAAENALRPIALGRKNWLFVGSPIAGQRAATLQSLLITAKLNQLDPLAWLTKTLERLPTTPYHHIDSLLPLA